MDVSTTLPSPLQAPLDLAALAARPIWVAWRNEPRDGKLTKVPHGRGGQARADDPATWLTRPAAETLAGKIVNGAGGGVGIELSDLGDGHRLGGIDLDTCRAPRTGAIEPWATEVIGRLETFTEISPSGTGVKLYFTYADADLPMLRQAMGTQWGRAWKRGGGEHPPAIELYAGNRFFAVTGDTLPGAPATLSPVPTETLLWLIGKAGPAFKGNPPAPNPAPLAGPDASGIIGRLDRAAAAMPRLGAVLSRLPSYGSRSEAAMALGSAIRAAGWSYDDMTEALRAHPATAGWAAEKGAAAGGRELRRVWDRAGEAPGEAAEPLAWGDPDMSVLRLNRRSPPPLPLAVLGPWGDWITAAAEAAACPPDYVLAPLLAAASALIGNSRWAQATPGWAEPPHLWVATVGDSGTGKSPGSDCLLRDVLPELERRMLGDFPDRLREWKAAAERAKAGQEAWEKDVRTAHKAGAAPPLPPDAEPPEPQAPRVRVNDVTIERVASLLATAAPKGLLIVRDELAGWLLGMNSYNDAGRAFWLEAYGGRPYRVERQKSPVPIIVPRLAVAVSGGTQPERLAMLMADADDGLLARLLWTWPDPIPFRLGREAPGVGWATACLDRLRLLDLAPGAGPDEAPQPVLVPLVTEALPLIEGFAQEMHGRQAEASGLMRSAYGKARGLALRLSLVIESLWWCAADGFDPPPSRISARAFAAAATLVADYFVPMAERTYGDAAIPDADRHAATLARWILLRRPGEVHVRHLQREVRLPGLGTADAIHEAAKVLVEADWLRPPVKAAGFAKGAARAAYPVNPGLWEPVQ